MSPGLFGARNANTGMIEGFVALHLPPNRIAMTDSASTQEQPHAAPASAPVALGDSSFRVSGVLELRVCDRLNIGHQRRHLTTDNIHRSLVGVDHVFI